MNRNGFDSARSARSIRCRRCGREIGADPDACPHCGVHAPAPLRSATMACVRCGSGIAGAHERCPACHPTPREDSALEVFLRDPFDLEDFMGHGVAWWVIQILLVLGALILSAYFGGGPS